MKKFYMQMLLLIGVVVGGESSWATSIIPHDWHQLPVGTNWESDYIPGKGRWALRVESENTLAVAHDINACGFDRVGNVGICTMMAPVFSKGVTFYENVAASKNTVVLGIGGTNYNVVYYFSDLVSGTLKLRLLVLNKQDEVVESISLFERH